MSRGKISAYCSLIGIKDVCFYLKHISNIERFLSEAVLPKNYGQVCLYIKTYQDAIIISFNETPPSITTVTHTCEQISSPYSNLCKGFTTELWSQSGVSFRKKCDVGMKQ